MKKILSFIIILLLTIVFIGNVKAKSSELEVTNVEILEKSDEVKANIENYKDLNINLSTIFFSKDDYVKYKITIKNNTKNTMKIEDILDNFNSEVLETSYDIEKKELKSNEEYTFILTIKYIKDIEEEKVTITSPLNIIINYDDGKTATIDINPDTKDSIITYFVIFVLSAISLFLVITKKGKKQLLGLMLIVSLIPITSNAISTKKEIIINNDIKIYGKTAVFKKGIDFNNQLNLLAQNLNNIIEFKRSNNLPDGFIPSEENIISTDESRIPIYAWFDNGIIYYYTKANNPLLNEDASKMFSNFTKLKALDLSYINTSYTINMNAMFSKCESLEELDLSNFNTENVSDMTWMFVYCEKLTEIDVSGFDTSNVTNMSAMFGNCLSLEELDLSNFDTSKVTDMSWMFGNDVGKNSNLKILDIHSFNTSNVTNMKFMFYNCGSLKQLDVSNFDTSNVEDMTNMFASCTLLEELDLSSFDTSNVTSMKSMFSNCTKLNKVNLLSFDTTKVQNMNSFFLNCQNLKELDLSSFDTRNVSDIAIMFAYDNNLKTIYVSNKFVTTNVTSSNYTFYNNNSLVGGNGTTFDNSYRDKTYARIDTEETPGYFTLKNS